MCQCFSSYLFVQVWNPFSFFLKKVWGVKLKMCQFLNKSKSEAKVAKCPSMFQVSDIE